MNHPLQYAVFVLVTLHIRFVHIPRNASPAGERRGETEGFITVGYCRAHGRGRGGRNWTVCRAALS
jgi:hypothetical protein